MTTVKNIFSYSVKCNGETFNGLDYQQKTEMINKLNELYSKTRPKPQIRIIKKINKSAINAALIANNKAPIYAV